MVIGGALLALLLYLAVPRLTTAYAENAHLKQTLAAKDAELARAHAQISELSTQLGEPAAMGAGRGQPRRRRGRRPRPAAPAMEQPPADEPLGAAVAAPPLAAAANATEVASLLAAAGAITRPACRAAWLREQADEAAHGRHRGGAAPQPYGGGDLEAPGVLDAALRARAPAGELIFLSVGDTRDHRREIKDPALKTISVDFLLNLLANLKQLRIDHYVILTTRSLCRKLQADHCEYSCVWTELWNDHPSLAAWGLKPGDMFLMWAQQWRYISAAMARGYRVMRLDTDVYFAEDPYPILKGPLFGRYEMVVQHDVEGRARPACERPHRTTPTGIVTCGSRDRGLALLNIGIVYLKSKPGGGVFEVINATWGRFLTRLGEAPAKPPHLNGRVDTQQLIDQPFMRNVVNEIAVADRAAVPPKPQGHWSVVPVGSAAVYPAGTPCALRDAAACEAIAAARARSAFLVQSVRPPRSTAPPGGGTLERVALAPDWLFGRGCLTHVRAPENLLAAAGADAGGASCRAPERTPGLATLAPGPSAGMLVATHFVYSMALKRKRAFRAFGWDFGDGRNRSTTAAYNGAAGSCWKRNDRAILLGHTFFTQTEGTKAVRLPRDSFGAIRRDSARRGATRREASDRALPLPSHQVMCALPKGGDTAAPECSCCAGLPSLSKLRPRAAGFSLESTGGGRIGDAPLRALDGCNDYQLFWD